MVLAKVSREVRKKAMIETFKEYPNEPHFPIWWIIQVNKKLNSKTTFTSQFEFSQYLRHIRKEVNIVKYPEQVTINGKVVKKVYLKYDNEDAVREM